MTKTSTENTVSAATITEKELWALFVKYTTKITLSVGPTVEQYKPDDLLRDPGNYGDMGDFVNEVADELLESGMPESDLDCRIEVLKHYVGNLEMLSTTFARLKVSLATMTDDDDRYRRPGIHSAEAA